MCCAVLGVVLAACGSARPVDTLGQETADASAGATDAGRGYDAADARSPTGSSSDGSDGSGGSGGADGGSEAEAAASATCQPGVGASCNANADCCSNNCDTANHICCAAGGGKSQPPDACGKGSDCCSNVCAGGSCQRSTGS